MASSSIRVAVGSANPVKLKAAEAGFADAFPDRRTSILPRHVASGVSDQPMSDEETLVGARNRVRELQRDHPGFDYFVGIEGGISARNRHFDAFAWVVISDGTREGESRTASFILPPEVEQLVRQGLELGDANDRVFGTTNSKQDMGAVGLLTRGLVTRVNLYQPAVVLALIPFLSDQD